jgi:hypothetical protein
MQEEIEMTQVTIQLDDRAFKALETAAVQSHTSVSKWIEKHIIQELKFEWPENYFSLFGSLDEDDLVEPAEIPFKYDSKRENL